MDSISLSVVIPVYNESAEVIRALDAIISYFKEKPWFKEIIIVNDGSSDNTGSLITQYADAHPQVRAHSYDLNQGKGYALKTGIAQARGTHTIFFDIDLAVPLTMTDRFIDTFQDPAVDIVIGTRKSKDAVIIVHQPWLREFLGKGFSRLTNIILGTSYSDITCGFKCFKTSVAQRLFSMQKTKRWGFDAEILYLAHRRSCTVKELPVTWKDSADSRVHIVHDTIKSFIELITIRCTRYPHN